MGSGIVQYALETDDDLTFDERDSAPFMPKCRVVDPAFTWGNDHPPRTPWEHTVIYELHVRGFSMKRIDISDSLRGTYSGLMQPGLVDHLKRLGVTAVELLPVHSFITDSNLLEKKLRNYWGYNTLGFFAPDRGYASVPDFAFAEFKEMVARLHSAQIEVILDVVYNHTAEGNELALRCRFGESIISHIIDFKPIKSATTSTTPAPEIHSIFRILVCFS
jgi:isoamylase